MKPDRLRNTDIVILRSLLKRGAAHLPVTLKKWKRAFTASLARKGLIRIFYEQVLDSSGASMRGPFYTLSIRGAYVAATLFPAPRGQSSQTGAGEGE